MSSRRGVGGSHTQTLLAENSLETSNIVLLFECTISIGLVCYHLHPESSTHLPIAFIFIIITSIRERIFQFVVWNGFCVFGCARRRTCVAMIPGTTGRANKATRTSQDCPRAQECAVVVVVDIMDKLHYPSP